MIMQIIVYRTKNHINKIFKDSELQKDSVIRKFLITADGGCHINAHNT